jgi:hypothetical protein
MQKRPETLAGLLARQHGVISLAQAERLGLSMTTIRYRIRPGGTWQRVLPGVYFAFSGSGIPDQFDMAAVLYCGTGCAITGLAALRQWGVRLPEPRARWQALRSAPRRDQPPEVVDVLVSAERRRTSRDYVRIHRTNRFPRMVTVRDEIPATLIPRALADAALLLDDVRDIRAVVAAAVQQRVCTPSELNAELGVSRLHNAARVRSVLAEVTGGIRSSPEGDLMDLIKKARLPMPCFNARLYFNGEMLAVPDAWWPAAGVAVEVDSREWHMSPEQWEHTMRRHAAMAAAGIRVLHFTPRQLRTEPDLVIGRIRDALKIGTPVAGIRTVPTR